MDRDKKIRVIKIAVKTFEATIEELMIIWWIKAGYTVV